MDATETVDVAGLVEAGLLNLDAVFKRADWRQVDGITTYTACVYGKDGDEPGEVEVVLESATEYGITAFRWAERDSGTYERGPITLDRDEAVEAGEEYASELDEEPDADDLIAKIVETGYFGGDADADDIKAICEEATKHSQGYLLLPAGEFCGHPIGRLWTTNGYLQCEKYVALDATHPSTAYAADALLRAVTGDDEE